MVSVNEHRCALPQWSERQVSLEARSAPLLLFLCRVVHDVSDKVELTALPRDFRIRLFHCSIEACIKHKNIYIIFIKILQSPFTSDSLKQKGGVD